MAYNRVDVVLAGVARNRRLLLLVWDRLVRLRGVRELDPRANVCLNEKYALLGGRRRLLLGL
eukprot:3999058-Pyramimonas_sp.AAC.1